MEFRRVLFRSDRKSTRLNSSHQAISYAVFCLEIRRVLLDRKSTRLNSSHQAISYAVFCLIKKNLRVTCGSDGSGGMQQLWSPRAVPDPSAEFFLNDARTPGIYALPHPGALPA